MCPGAALIVKISQTMLVYFPKFPECSCWVSEAVSVAWSTSITHWGCTVTAASLTVNAWAYYNPIQLPNMNWSVCETFLFCHFKQTHYTCGNIFLFEPSSSLWHFILLHYFSSQKFTLLLCHLPLPSKQETMTVVGVKQISNMTLLLYTVLHITVQFSAHSQISITNNIVRAKSHVSLNLTKACDINKCICGIRKGSDRSLYLNCKLEGTACYTSQLYGIVIYYN